MTEQRIAVDTRHRHALDPVLVNPPWDARPIGAGLAVRHSSPPTVIAVRGDGREVPSDHPTFEVRTPMGNASGRSGR